MAAVRPRSALPATASAATLLLLSLSAFMILHRLSNPLLSTAARSVHAGRSLGVRAAGQTCGSARARLGYVLRGNGKFGGLRGVAAMSSEAGAAPAAPGPAAEKKEDEEPPAPPTPEEFAKTELRVGKIVEVWPHPEADKLWCEKIDLGEEEPRQILSGLREFYSEEEMMDRMVVVVANLKPSKLRGMASAGMVLAASNDAHDKVELVAPPEGAEIGERVSLECFDCKDTPPANAKKKGNSVWRSVAPYMRTSGDGVAMYNGVPLITSAGEITVPTLKDCTVG